MQLETNTNPVHILWYSTDNTTRLRVDSNGSSPVSHSDDANLFMLMFTMITILV